MPTTNVYISSLLFLAAIGLFVFWIGYWCVHLLAIAYGKWKLYGSSDQLPLCESSYPPVSILKPLTGVDPNLLSNLETFFTMHYPKYELLFCISDNNDPSLLVVKSLMNKYPEVDASYFIGGEMVGVNPKVNNLQPGYTAAKYDLFMISDSGVHSLYCELLASPANERTTCQLLLDYIVKDNTLADMVMHMEENVGLVHQMPFVCDREGFPATLEKIYFGTAHARIYLVADLFGINCATGMSSLMRKSIIDEAGGLKAFGCYLAEDYFLAKAIKDRGMKTCISREPAWQNSGTCQIPSFQKRVMRWAKLRITMVPATIIFEPISECMVLGALAAWANYWLFQWDPLAIFLLHVLVWFLLDYVLLTIVQNGPLPFTKMDFVLGWFLRELSAPFWFLCALCQPTMRWRTRVYRLKWGGVVEELKP